MDKYLAQIDFSGYLAFMANASTRKYNKTKFEGVFFRESAKRDPRTGKPDLIYAFWYQDAEGKGHWKTVGRHSEGVRPSTARTARAKFLAEFKTTGVNPIEREKITVGQVVEAYLAWGISEGKYIERIYTQYKSHLQARIHSVPIVDLTPNFLSSIKAYLLSAEAHNGSWPWRGKTKKSIENKPRRILSSASANMILGFIRAAINHAIATDAWNGKNPLASLGGKWKMPKLTDLPNFY
ncbi:MAG: phage integrase SAM-like domain-containing protein [Desulfovibrio sp.]|nr:phage integrase SAM-like domain-containing protein [Desulfovibrio sp.]